MFYLYLFCDYVSGPRQSGSVVYSFATPYDRKANTLYINVVPGYYCPNRCRFCSRSDAIAGKQNIYEKKAGTSLFLAKAPAVSDIINEARIKAKKPLMGFFGATKEIAFVGLGEPLAQLPLVCDTTTALRADGYEGRIGVDTDGLVKCLYPYTVSGCLETIPRNPASELKHAGLTDIRISVNATSASEYEALCRPPFANAFEKLCEFTRDCIAAGIRTCASFVVGFDDGDVRTKERGEYVKFARSLGVRPRDVIIRQYTPPISGQ